MENYGFVKEVDWVEHKLRPPQTEDEKLKRLSDMIVKKYRFIVTSPKSIRSFLKEQGGVQQFFDIIDKTYENIYGTVPMTPKMREMMISNFKLLARAKDIGLIYDSDGRIVAFAIQFPSLAKAANKSKGHVTLPFLIRFLKLKRKPDIIDLGLIGVLPEYESKGVATVLISELIDIMKRESAEFYETNLNLEDNAHILNLLKHFDKEQHKKRRCYVKTL